MAVLLLCIGNYAVWNLLLSYPSSHGGIRGGMYMQFWYWVHNLLVSPPFAPGAPPAAYSLSSDLHWRLQWVLLSALHLHILPNLISVPLIGTLLGYPLLYAVLVWWYLPYLERFPEAEIPSSIPFSFISQLKTARIRALHEFLQEHVRWLDTMRMYKRNRAK
jgi:hypothetical protein